MKSDREVAMSVHSRISLISTSFIIEKSFF